MDNQQPSLLSEEFEGSTTKTYPLEQWMKSIGPSGPKCRAPYIGDDIVWSYRKL